jgi:hypothetical protein
VQAACLAWCKVQTDAGRCSRRLEYDNDWRVDSYAMPFQPPDLCPAWTNHGHPSMTGADHAVEGEDAAKCLALCFAETSSLDLASGPQASEGGGSQ